MKATQSLLSSLVVCSLAGGASAGSIALFLENGDDGGQTFNTTFFRLTNTSAPGITLDTWSMTVGDTMFLFDQLYLRREAFVGGSGSESAMLTIGERDDDGMGGDVFAYSFMNFGPGTGFEGQWDIDFDNGAFDVDARRVLFNNGVAPNAVATFSFSDGSQFSYTFPDLPIQDSYLLEIPSPGTVAVAFVATVLLRRRRSA